MHAARTPRARMLGIFGGVIGFCGLIACLAGQPPLYTRLFALLIPPPTYIGDLIYGESESGTLSDSAGVAYTFEARSGDVITASIDRDEAQIQILDTYGATLATANGTLYAALLPSDGTYTLVLRGAAGSFNVRIENQDTLPRRPLSFDTTVQDHYAGGGGQFWTFVAREGDSLQIDLTAAEFTPVFVLLDPRGIVIQAPFAPLPLTGDYVLIVRSADGGTGSYQLRVAR